MNKTELIAAVAAKAEIPNANAQRTAVIIRFMVISSV